MLLVCDVCDADDTQVEAPLPSDMADPPIPSEIHAEEDDAMPPPSPAASAKRSFLPFAITSPKIGRANLKERLPFSLPFAR